MQKREFVILRLSFFLLGFFEKINEFSSDRRNRDMDLDMNGDFVKVKHYSIFIVTAIAVLGLTGRISMSVPEARTSEFGYNGEESDILEKYAVPKPKQSVNLCTSKEEIINSAMQDPNSWYCPDWYAEKRLTVGDYTSVIHAYGGQDEVDAEDSSIVDVFDRTCIGDHAGDGFDAIKTNDTAYIGGEVFHKVRQYDDGLNLTTHLETSAGHPLKDAEDVGIVMYCCNDASGRQVTITFWQKG